MTNNPIKDDNLIALIMFDNRIKQLHKHTKRWKNGARVTCKLKTASPSELKTSGLPHDTTLAAAIVNLRSFMLINDKVYFPKIVNIVSAQHSNDSNIVANLRKIKKTWQAYDINEKNTENTAKMQGCFDINGDQITTYKSLLEHFMYGKYLHADDRRLFGTMLVLESNGLHFAIARAELQSCVYMLQDFLYDFNKTYVKPILKQNAARVRTLKVRS